jgi:DNA-binding PadR family transcriptional regulator
MLLKACKIVVISNREIKHVSKLYKGLVPRDFKVLYTCYFLGKTGKKITVYTVGKMLKTFGHSPARQSVQPRFEVYVKHGLLNRSNETVGNFRKVRHTYTITPALHEYITKIEERLRTTRFDY